jgi:hypothetical protein
MRKTRESQLALARREKLLVNFTRPFEQGSVLGYVLDIGSQFFVMALVSDGMRLNGFQCFRLKDVRELRVPHKYSAFVEVALKKRRAQIPKESPVAVSKLQNLLLSAGRKFPLVTIHREQIDPDVCYIGRVIDVSKDFVSLLEIGPDACWDAKSERYRLSEITRVDFGGQYEEALYLVGGRPRKLARSQ